MALLTTLRTAVILAATLWLALQPSAAPAQAPEREVKAVFLFNFSLFVEWPPEAFEEETSPLVIGVLGDDPFGPVLDEVIRDEVVGGRPLEIRRYASVAEIDTCHILFIARSERAHVESILESLKRRSILTVSDLENFAVHGGMIRLATVGNKIRLQINLDAARDSHLDISSKLLRPAEIVASGRD